MITKYCIATSIYADIYFLGGWIVSWESGILLHLSFCFSLGCAVVCFGDGECQIGIMSIKLTEVSHCWHTACLVLPCLLQKLFSSYSVKINSFWYLTDRTQARLYSERLCVASCKREIFLIMWIICAQDMTWANAAACSKNAGVEFYCQWTYKSWPEVYLMYLWSRLHNVVLICLFWGMLCFLDREENLWKVASVLKILWNVDQVLAMMVRKF